MITPNQIIRSNRKSLALTINDRAELIVRAPLSYSDRKIYNFIASKEGWIIKKQMAMRASNMRNAKICVVDGEVVNILCQPYTLHIGKYVRTRLTEQDIYLPDDKPRERLILFLMRWCKRQVTSKVEYYARILGVQYSTIRISKAHTCWGSCGAHNSLNFSYRLIFCTPNVMDYIVVHELSHIKYKNHGKRFWSCVRSVLPNYKLQERWLKNNTSIMHMI